MELTAGDTATLPMGNQPVPQRYQYQNLSRPNSLLAPEKEPITFNINLVGAPPEVEQLIEHVRTVASSFLYHWKTFPISKIKQKCKLFWRLINILFLNRSASTYLVNTANFLNH